MSEPAVLVVEVRVEVLQQRIDKLEAENAELKKAFDELGSPTEPDAMCAELVKCGTFTAEAQEPREFVSIEKELLNKIRRDRDKAEAALQKIRMSRTRHSVFDPVTALNENIQIANEVLEVSNG